MLIKLVTRQDNTFFEVNIVTISKLEFKSGTWVCSLKEMESTKILVLTNIDAVTPNFSMYSQHTTLNVLWHDVQNNSPSPCFFCHTRNKAYIYKTAEKTPSKIPQASNCIVHPTMKLLCTIFQQYNFILLLQHQAQQISSPIHHLQHFVQ